MNTLARIADAGARKAWLRSNRNRFNGSGTSMPRLLVDVSAIIRHDAQTGIQRVVRSVWSELSKRDDVNFRAQPVYATSRRGYCYAPVDFLDSRPLSFDGAPAGLGAGDRFLGLDLSAHLLPKYA